MTKDFSHTLISVVQRLVDAPENTLSKVAARFSTGFEAEPLTGPMPDHVTLRLEGVFDALAELPFQPDYTAALDLACDALQGELPTEAVAAGLYDINADEVRIVAARGMEHDLLRGTIMSPKRCFAGHASEAAVITSGGPEGADWLGAGEEGSSVLLCPILHETHLLGVIALADPLCAAEFTSHDVELVTYVAGQLAGFIQTRRQIPSIIPPAQPQRA